ncbi:MAG: phosphatase PAP2 family protein [Solitalea-like symbiont of Tyrophagus putrescentiae]
MNSSYLETINNINQTLFFYINNGLANRFFDYIMPIFRDVYTWIPFYILAIVLAFIKFKLRALLLLIGVAILIIITDYGSASIIKPYFSIPRPCNNILIKDHVRILVHCGSGYSFISAHASNHFGLAAFFSACLFYNKNLIAGILFIWALLIGFAQIYVGVHYPIDIIIGGIYGTIVGIVIGRATKKFLNIKQSRDNDN